MKLKEEKSCQADASGTVRIFIRLCDPNGVNVKGNLSKSFTVYEAKVSEVYKLLLNAVEAEVIGHS